MLGGEPPQSGTEIPEHPDEGVRKRPANAVVPPRPGSPDRERMVLPGRTRRLPRQVGFQSLERMKDRPAVAGAAPAGGPDP